MKQRRLVKSLPWVYFLLSSALVFSQATTLANETGNNTPGCGNPLPIAAGQTTSYCSETFPPRSGVTGTTSPSTGWVDTRSGILTNPYDVVPSNISEGVGTASGDVSTLTTLSTAKIFVHTQFWFCNSGSQTFTFDNVIFPQCNGHNKVGHPSSDSGYVSKTIDDIWNRGIQGILADWQGPRFGCWNLASPPTLSSFSADCGAGSNEDLRTSAYLSAASAIQAQHSTMNFALVYDDAAFKFNPNCGNTQFTTTTPQNQSLCIAFKIQSDLTYAANNFFTRTQYLKDSSDTPVVLAFVDEGAFLNQCTSAQPCNLPAGTCVSSADCWGKIWGSVQDGLAAQNPPVSVDFVFENTGGFTHARSGGSFLWVTPDHTVPPTSTSQINLTQGTTVDNWYAAAQSAANANKISFGVAWKGFDSENANWYNAGFNPQNTGGIVAAQRCGQTWLDTWQKNNGETNVKYIQIGTWDDYEEGTEIETGIDNCANVTLDAIPTGSTTLTFHITFSDSTFGSERTIDHYSVFYSTDGNTGSALNLLTTVPVDTTKNGTYTFNFGGFSIPSPTVFYIKAVGKPSIENHMSNGASSQPCSKTDPCGPPPPPPGGCGPLGC